jgi:hypothetical protein
MPNPGDRVRITLEGVYEAQNMVYSEFSSVMLDNSGRIAVPDTSIEVITAPETDPDGTRRVLSGMHYIKHDGVWYYADPVPTTTDLSQSQILSPSAPTCYRDNSGDLWFQVEGDVWVCARNRHTAEFGISRGCHALSLSELDAFWSPLTPEKDV